MDGAIVSEKEVASYEGTSALQTFERSLFGVCARWKLVVLSKESHDPTMTHHQPLEPHDCATLNAWRNLRDLSCLLLCSLRLNARLQNWHLYFFSGTTDAFREGVGAEAVGLEAVAAAGILQCSEWSCDQVLSLQRGVSDRDRRLTMVSIDSRKCSSFIPRCR